MPTTTTASTTSSTSTTIPLTPCIGGSGAPTCDGTCDPGLACGSYYDGGSKCACFPVGTTGCSFGQYPQCGGACPGATACGAFQVYEPSSGTFVDFCACVDPSVPCSTGPGGSCVNVGYCPPGLACQYTPIAPHQNCPCCGCGVPF